MTVTEFRVDTTGMDYHGLNAMLNLYGPDGTIQFDKDREAARQYFLQHVNQNTVFFHDLDEKLDYLVENKYYDPAVLAKYDRAFLHRLFDHVAVEPRAAIGRIRQVARQEVVEIHNNILLGYRFWLASAGCAERSGRHSAQGRGLPSRATTRPPSAVS